MGWILTSGPARAQGEFGKACTCVREGSVCCKEGVCMGREALLCSALCKHKRKCSVVRWGRNLILDVGKEMGLGAARLVIGMEKMLRSVFWVVLAWGFLRGLHCPLLTAAEGPAGSRSLRRMQVVELEPSPQPGCRAHPGGWRCLKSSQGLRPNFANGSNFCSRPNSCSQTV